jgi:hypothetical protein
MLTHPTRYPNGLLVYPKSDYRLIKSPTHLETLINLTLKEACREGAKGALHEARLYFKDFGFALSDIMQTVHYWWGTKDNTVVHSHAKEIEERVKNKVIHYKKDEGHLSLYIYFFMKCCKLSLQKKQRQVHNCKRLSHKALCSNQRRLH